MGKGPVLQDGTLNILEDFRFGPQFIEFLQYYSSGDFANDEVELVINGDFLNLLQTDYLGAHTPIITEAMMVHICKSIIAGHRAVFTALKDFAAGPSRSIAYVIGNHDIGLMWDGPRKVLRDCIGEKLRFYADYYEFSGVRVEHGHRNETINATDPQKFCIDDPEFPAPILNLPWGSLFVTSFLPQIKKQRPFVDKVKPFTAYIRWGLVHDTFFIIKTGVFILVSLLKMALLSRRHTKLDWAISWPHFKHFSIYQSLVRDAKRELNREPDLHALIWGHTHMLRYRQWGSGKEYYNIGAWNEVTSLDIADFGLHHKLSYALIELREGQRAKVQLREWKGLWRPEVEALHMPVNLGLN